MKIVIDMQGAQTEASKKRGVGRYTREMAKALIRARQPEDEIYLALNGTFTEECEALIESFSGLIPRQNIKVWNWYAPIDAGVTRMQLDLREEELFREWFLAQFDADIIWSTNLQEGLGEKNIATSARLTKGKAVVCVTLHDVTPLLYPKDCLGNSSVKEWYMSKIKYAQNSDCIITDSKFSKQEIEKRLDVAPDKVECIPLGANFNSFYPDHDHLTAQSKGKFIYYTGGTDKYKNLKKLIESFAFLPKEIQKEYAIIITGFAAPAEKNKLIQYAKSHGIANDKFCFKGYATDEEMRRLLQTCGAFVVPSLAEGFGLPAVEAMACGAPTLVSNVTSLTEIVDDDEMMFDPLNPREIAEKITRVLTDSEFTNHKIEKQIARAKTFTWEAGGEKLYRLFAKVAEQRHTAEENYTKACLLQDLSVLCASKDPLYRLQMAYSIEDSTLFASQHTIYVDMSSVVLLDYVTGVQRVVIAIANNLRAVYQGKKDVRVVPVYSSPDQKIYYKAHYNGKRYVKRAVGTGGAVQFQDGDLFIMPDIHPVNTYNKKEMMRSISRRGVKVISILHDIIPVEHKTFYPESFVKEFEQYLRALPYGDGVISVSKATMDAYARWCKAQNIVFPANFILGYNYSGCDFENTTVTTGLQEGYRDVLNRMQAAPTFLMVSTIEPRKKQDQILAAMEVLWKQGVDANLILVGRNGWSMNGFVQKMQNHPERGNHFYWLTGVSDEYLNLIYQNATAVIFASLDEGYGLAVVEGANHHKPLILRDIPIFREIAGNHATYFDSETGEGLAEVLNQWLADYSQGKTISSQTLNTVSWKESVLNLLKMVEYPYQP